MLKIQKIEIKEDVYDLSINGNHNFFANGILVHNCCEISLLPNQFCNLTEINASSVESQEDYNNRAKAAAIIGTLQAAWTDFHYLRPIWKKNTEKEALIGVGMTGIASNQIFNYNIKEAAKIVKEENDRIAKIIGINKAARATTIKPSGCMIPATIIRTSEGDLSLYDIFKLSGIELNNMINEYREWYDVKKNISVYDENNNKNLITKLFVNGNEETIEFIMEDGSTIECTPNHKFLMTNGQWKAAKEITENDDFLIK